MEISLWRVRTEFIRWPVVWGWRPVRSMARAGVQTGQVDSEFVNNVPSDASASI